MIIIEICKQYEEEVDFKQKILLKKEIINFCKHHPDTQIPKIAQKLYLEYLLVAKPFL